MARIFISYRRNDSADIVGRIFEHLAARLGKDNVFKDVDSIPLGADFRTMIGDAIAQCEVLLAVIGPDWVNDLTEDGQRRINDPNDYVRIELEGAFARELTIIPLLVRGAEMPATDDLPDSLSDLPFLNAIAVRADPDFTTDISRLLDVLPDLPSPVEGTTRERQIEAKIDAKTPISNRTVGCTMTIAIAASLCMLAMVSMNYYIDQPTEDGIFSEIGSPLSPQAPPTSTSSNWWMIAITALVIFASVLAIVIWYRCKRRAQQP